MAEIPGIPIAPPTQQLQAPTTSTTPTEVIRQQAVSQDFVVLRLAVTGLVLAILASMLGVGVLSWMDKEVPEGILAIGATAVGALATMLIRPPRSD